VAERAGVGMSALYRRYPSKEELLQQRCAEPCLRAAAERAQSLNVELFDRTKASGAVRADVEVTDLSLIFEQLAVVRLGDEQRTRQLRRRYLELALEAIRFSGGPTLPGPAPTWPELADRWRPPT